MRKPLIFEIKGNSLDDGPGIRTVIFMKGCPLSCVWCHNPEGMKPIFEHSFDKRECIKCLACVEVCNQDAITYDDSPRVDRSKCLKCFTCTSLCPTGALSIVGKSMSVEDIVAYVVRDKPFFDTSGGGVTLSGGEPAMFMDFCSELLIELKKHKIHTLLETCGQFDMTSFVEKMFSNLDEIYFDIKLFDESEHKKYCGVSNEIILENFRILSSMNDRKTLPRVPLVPGITDTDSNLNATADFLVSCCMDKVRLLAYNPLWPDKLEKFGGNGHVPDKMKLFMKPEHLKSCEAIFYRHGIKTI
jgi:pyruvate formate lyase activating enzyme